MPVLFGVGRVENTPVLVALRMGTLLMVTVPATSVTCCVTRPGYAARAVVPTMIAPVVVIFQDDFAKSVPSEMYISMPASTRPVAQSGARVSGARPAATAPTT